MDSTIATESPPSGHGSASGAPRLVVAGRVATITLSRPEHHNRIDPDDLPVLMQHLDQVEHDPAIQVLVWRGAGSRSFSSGYTVQAIRSRLDERAFERMLNRVERLGCTTIAVIHGGVYGGATDLALCCDLRIGVTTSRMFMPAARFGLHYYPDGLRRYQSRLGPAAARKLLLTATTIEADEMLRIGFLTDCVPPEALAATLQRSIDDALACEPGAVAAMKASLDELGQVDAGVMARIEARYLASLQSPALAERLAERLAARLAAPPAPSAPSPTPPTSSTRNPPAA